MVLSSSNKKIIYFILFLSLISCLNSSKEEVKEKNEECNRKEINTLEDDLVIHFISKVKPKQIFYEIKKIKSEIPLENIYNDNTFYTVRFSKLEELTLNIEDTLNFIIDNKKFVITDFKRGVSYGGKKIIGCELYSARINGRKQNYNKNNYFYLEIK